MRSIRCPRCDEPCVTAEYDAVEIDSCPACQGVWLDGGELEALAGSPAAPAPREAELGPAELDCPLCTDKLVKERYGQTDVVVDRCPNGDGVWLDEGELEAILTAAQEPQGRGSAEEPAAEALHQFFQGGAQRRREGASPSENAED